MSVRVCVKTARRRRRIAYRGSALRSLHPRFKGVELAPDGAGPTDIAAGPKFSVQTMPPARPFKAVSRVFNTGRRSWTSLPVRVTSTAEFPRRSSGFLIRGGARGLISQSGGHVNGMASHGYCRAFRRRAMRRPCFQTATKMQSKTLYRRRKMLYASNGIVEIPYIVSQEVI